MSLDHPRIFVAESCGFPEAAASMLRQVGDLVLADSTREDLLDAVPDIDVLWIRLRHKIDADVMKRGRRLRVIVSPTTGLNHVDLTAAHERSIDVLSLRGETEFLRTVRATSEHTLALILALVRRLPAAAVHVQSGAWNRDRFKGRELFEKTAGIVGYGRIGQQVARYLLALGMEVWVSDPHLQTGLLEPGLYSGSLAELLRRADVVTIHVNYTPQNHRVFGREFFSGMKPGSWFINTSRGELLHEDAMLEALEAGRIAGAALDVLSDENQLVPGKNPLIEYARRSENLIITPHIGGCTLESMEKTEVFMAQKLCARLAESCKNSDGGWLKSPF